MKSLKVLLFLLRTTFMAFGGGNALFPFIRKEAVVKNKWLTEKEFDKLVVTTNMIPGPSVVESLSYISMKVLGPLKGAIITLIGILPHILFALGLLIIAQEFLPKKYLFVINVSVIPVIIGVLLAFTWRFVKISNKEIGFPKMMGLLIFTIIFSLFVPSPWNITAFVMIGVIIFTMIFEYFKIKKEGKK
ncbi:MAG: chromate transporter [Mycoplasmatales bacterium]|nr:chromate transporter [Mycoplasmatales bacterium]